MADQKKTDIQKIAIVAVTIIFFCFQMYLALVKQLTPMLQSPLHLVLALTVVYLYNPVDKKYRKKVLKKAEHEGRTASPQELNKFAVLNYIDILAYIGIAFLLYYVVNEFSRLRDFVQFIDPVTTVDKIAMVVTILLLLEAVRRTLGGILFGFICVFIAYAWLAPYLPGILFTKGKPFAQMLDQFTIGMTMTEAGVFGLRCIPLHPPCFTSSYSVYFSVNAEEDSC